MDDREVEKRELKSWYRQQYPPHKCLECNLEHHRPLPNVKKGDITWIPFELSGVAEGEATMSLPENPDVKTRAYVYALIWGIPEQPRPLLSTVLLMN